MSEDAKKHLEKLALYLSMPKDEYLKRIRETYYRFGSPKAGYDIMLHDECVWCGSHEDTRGGACYECVYTVGGERKYSYPWGTWEDPESGISFDLKGPYEERFSYLPESERKEILNQ
jgi:hypothetical protein